MLRTSQLDYHLPPELIATRPAEPRDSARLLVVRRDNPKQLEHLCVRDLPDVLCAEDTLIFNTTKVLPARLAGRRRDTQGRVGGLFLSARTGEEAGPVWSVLLTAGGRLVPGTIIDLDNASGSDSGVSLQLIRRDAEAWIAEVRTSQALNSQRAADSAGPDAATQSAALLDRAGATPLPPYILKSRRDSGQHPPESFDRERYQTVYASDDWRGSVAAPTAGLHFTPELLRELEHRRIHRRDVVLHVGEGTFRPVKAECIEQHEMHAEWAFVPPETVRSLAERSSDRRIVAIGTTSARAIESLESPIPPEALRSGHAGWTTLLITPGRAWRHVDALLTNFHLPRSTLMSLVSALLPEGPARLLEIYREAIARGYRFYSYGDAMLILP